MYKDLDAIPENNVTDESEGYALAEVIDFGGRSKIVVVGYCTVNMSAALRAFQEQLPRDYGCTWIGGGKVTMSRHKWGTLLLKNFVDNGHNHAAVAAAIIRRTSALEVEVA